MNPLNLLRSLKEKGFFYLLSANFFAQLLGFAASLLITRFLPPEQLGEVKILQSYAYLFIVFAGSGFNAAVLKYCSEDRTEASRIYLLKYAFSRTLLTAAAAVLILVGLAITGLITTSGYLSRWLVVYSLAIPFIVLVDLFLVYLLAVKRARQMSRAQAAYKLINFLLVVGFTWRWGVPGFVLGTLAANIVGLLPIIPSVSLRFLSAPRQPVPAGIYSLAFFSMLFYSTTSLGQYGDIFILDHFITDREAIGFYSLATYFVLAATQFTMTIQSTLTPYFSQHGHDPAWFWKNLRQNQLLSMAGGLAASVGIYIAAWVLIRVLYGPTYLPALGYLVVLALRYLIFSAYAVISAAFIGIGKIKYTFFGVAVSTPVGLLLAYLLQQDYGAFGVAWAQVAGALIMLLIQLLLLRRLNATPWPLTPVP